MNMKKMNINKLVILASLLSVFVSCGNDDDLDDVRTGGKSVVTIDQTSVSVTEGDDITFTLTIDKPSNRDIDYKIELVGGTGSFRDYTSSGEETTIGEGGYGQGTIGHKLVFPAYATTATFTITPTKDLLVEDNETLEIWLRSSGNGLGLVDEASSKITINVADYVSNDIGLRLDWAQSTTDIHGTIQGGTYATSAGVDAGLFTDYDFDFYVFDSGFVDVTSSAAATGASPELAEILNADIPDGIYSVYVDLYDSGPTPLSPFQHDLKLTISKYGVWTTTVQIPTSSNDVFSDFVVDIEKTGSTYTVKDYYTTDLIISGKNSNFTKKQLVKSKLRKRK